MSLMPMQKEPFIFGKGGKRMTPDEIAKQRALSQQMMRAGVDFSPVASPWQGLARVGQGVLGAFDDKRARKAGEANAAESRSVLESLMSPEGQTDSTSVLAALANPYLDEQTRGIAELEYKRRNPAPQAPTEFERSLQASGVIQGSPEWVQAMKTKVSNTLDPWTNMVVGGNSITGRQSDVQRTLNGMGAAPPDVLPPDFDFGAPTIQNTPAPDLGANGMPQVLTRQQYMAVANALGQDKTDEWVRRNNVKVAQ